MSVVPIVKTGELDGVITEASFEYPELPVPLNARVLYAYAVLA